jgi:hypothetical protein
VAAHEKMTAPCKAIGRLTRAGKVERCMRNMREYCRGGEWSPIHRGASSRSATEDAVAVESAPSGKILTCLAFCCLAVGNISSTLPTRGREHLFIVPLQPCPSSPDHRPSRTEEFSGGRSGWLRTPHLLATANIRERNLDAPCSRSRGLCRLFCVLCAVMRFLIVALREYISVESPVRLFPVIRL